MLSAPQLVPYLIQRGPEAHSNQQQTHLYGNTMATLKNVKNGDIIVLYVEYLVLLSGRLLILKSLASSG